MKILSQLGEAVALCAGRSKYEDGWMDGCRSRVALSVTTDGRGNISQRDVALVRKKKGLATFGAAGRHGDGLRQVSVATGGPACCDLLHPSRLLMLDED